MGRYKLRLSKECDNHLAYWRKVNDTAILHKIDKIFNELIQHPKTGTGKPEALKGDLIGYWSRRLNKKERIVYQIDDSIVVVFINSLKGHYGDK